MMQPGPFNTFLANACRVDEKTVIVYTRELKEAGRMTSGGRGRYAPHMRPIDAARALIALMATDRPSEAVAVVDRFREMRPRQPDDTQGTIPDFLSDQPTLEQALVRLLALDPDPNSWRYDFPAFQIARNERTAMLEWGMKDPNRLIFRAPVHDTSPEARSDLYGIRTSCLVAPNVIQKIAADMWVDRLQGFDEQGQPLEINHPWNQEGTPAERHARLLAIYDYVRNRDSDWREGGD